MSFEPTSSNSPSAESRRPPTMNGDFISVGEALKLVPSFKGDKQEVLAFIGNVDMAFAVINPVQEDVLYKFVLMWISGEPQTAIIHRNLNNWTELKEFLKNAYIEKRMLDIHASQLFKARQGKDEKIAEWIQRIQTLGLRFCESALLNCSDEAREGISDLSDRLRNICFVQGLVSDHIQTIVWSRNYRNFDEIAETALVEESVDEIAETALVEESAITSKQDRYRAEGSTLPRCGSCGKVGHLSNKCFAREKREAWLSSVVTNAPENSSGITCLRCGEKGHLARHCRKPPGKGENYRSRKWSGNDVRRPESSRLTVSSTQ